MHWMRRILLLVVLLSLSPAKVLAGYAYIYPTTVPTPSLPPAYGAYVSSLASSGSPQVLGASNASYPNTPDLFYVQSGTASVSAGIAAATVLVSFAGNNPNINTSINVAAGATISNSLATIFPIYANNNKTTDINNAGALTKAANVYGNTEVIKFDSGGINLNNTGSGTITGNIVVPTATMNFSGSATPALNGNITTTGALNLTISGSSNQNLITTISAGANSSIVNSGTGDINGNVTLGNNSTLNMYGTGSWLNGVVVLGSNSAVYVTGASDGIPSSVTVGSGSSVTLSSSAGNITGAINGTSNSTLYIGTGSQTVSFSTGQNITGFSNINIASGSTLTRTGGTTSGGTINNSGTLAFSGGTNNDAIINSATMNVSNNYTNTGNITNNSTLNVTGGIMTNSGTLTNNGTASISGGATLTQNNTLTNAASKTMTVAGTLNGSGTINNSGTINSTGTIGGTGALNNSSGATISMTAGTYSRTGVLTNSSGATINTSINFAPVAGSSNAGTIAVSGGTFAPAANFINTGTLTFNTGSTFTAPTFAADDNSGTINLNGVVTINNALNGGTGSILNIGNTSAATINMNAAYSGIRTINLVTSGTTLTADNAISNFDTFSLASGTSATFTSDLIGRTSAAVVNNSGDITFGTGATVSTIDSINLLAGGNMNVTKNGTLTLTDTDIIGSTSSDLTISGVSTLSTNALIDNVSTITINNGGTLSIRSGGSITDFDSMVLNGTLEIQNGANFIVGAGTDITGTTGNVTNAGQFYIVDTNFAPGGNFTNQSTGILSVNGTPTLTFNTFTNAGTLISAFSIDNSLPQITATSTDLTGGSIIISYQNNYIAGGDHLLLTSTNAITGTPNALLPPPSTYIREWSFNTTANTLSVNVDRIGFDGIATDPAAKVMGAFLESLGSGSPTADQLVILNALEHITDPGQLNQALISLLPAFSAQLTTLAVLNHVLGLVESHLATVHMPVHNTIISGYSSGEDDVDTYEHGAWVRPFVNSGTQQQRGALLAYDASTNGVAFGIDKKIASGVTLGAGGSISNSKVTNQPNDQTVTNIKNYQGMLYGSFRSKNDGYIDAILAVGLNNYSASRKVLPGYTSVVANSEYTGQQLTLKTVAGRDFVLGKYYQITPMASAQYSYLRQFGYQETGAGSYNMIINPKNSNLFRLGVGAKASVPFSTNKTIGVPSVFAMVYADAKGGDQDTNAQFVSGGPVLSTQVQPSKVMARMGASLDFKIVDKLELTASYSYEIRRGYQGHEGFINLRYMF